MSRSRDLLGLGLFLAVCLSLAAIGGAVTTTSVGTWYQTLEKPSFNPPDWVFAPVWTILFITIAVAGWRVWRRNGFSTPRSALIVYAAQLALNLAWSIVFFGFRSIGAALIEIVFLLAAILATAVLFWRHDRLAGMLLIPYAAWVSFAVVLNAALWTLN